MPREQVLSLHAKVTRNPAGDYEVTLLTRGASGIGQRSFANSSCSHLAEATALVMAIAIDPKRVDERVAARTDDFDGRGEVQVSGMYPASISEGEVTLSQPRMLPTGSFKLSGSVSNSAGAASKSGPWNLGGMVLAGTGTLPVVDLGVMATAGLRLRSPLAIRFGVGGYLPQRRPIENSSGSITLHVLFLETEACIRPTHRDWYLHACYGGQLGRMSAEGNNLENYRTAVGVQISTGAEIQVGYSLGTGVSLIASAGAAIGVLRPRFGVKRDGRPEQVFRSESVLTRLGLGVALELP
jgi:RNA polymerase sigma-70 factor, ECF subfamily